MFTKRQFEGDNFVVGSFLQYARKKIKKEKIKAAGTSAGVRGEVRTSVN